jgi:serine/threonine protein kinase/WD40 repeat protein
MDRPTFQHVETVFHDALAVPEASRSTFLDAACAGNPELRAAVDELLRHADPADDTGAFLASPVSELSALLRPQPPPRMSRPDIRGYEILEELGRGGMGVVYRARQASLNRIVALKMLLPGEASGEMLARFRAEADALARLHHPNIVMIYDIGTWEGRPYFTMEYIAGPSLDRLLAGRPQDIAASARLIETLARTIAAVHQHGILHRDLKPANILLQKHEVGRITDEPGQEVQSSPFVLHASCLLLPKITDFGLAKDQAASGKVTQAGVILGTPSYMAPEQARKSVGGIGPGVDIYALGSMLYEMLTGRPPFQGDTPAETITQLIHDDPASPASLRPRLPRDLVTICLKCLEKSPRKRYATALDLAEDLRRFQAGEPIRARHIGVVGRAFRWCRRRPLVAGLLLCSVALAVALIATVLVYNARLKEALSAERNTTTEQRQEIVQLNVEIGIHAIAEGDSFTALLRFTEALRLDEGIPDREDDDRRRITAILRRCPRLLQLQSLGETILCTRAHAEGGWMAEIGTNNQLHVSDMRTGRPVGVPLRLDHTPIDGAISPDGKSLATISPAGRVIVWDLETGRPQDVATPDSKPTRKVAFYKDGRILILEQADGDIRLWDRKASWIVALPLTGPVPSATLSDNDCWLLTVRAESPARVWDLAAGKAVAGPPVSKQTVSRAAISNDGRRVGVLGADGALRIWDVPTAQWLGRAARPGPRVRQIAFSPNADRVVTLGGDHAIQVWRVASGDQVAACAQQDDTIMQAQFSADGRLLVTTNEAGVVQVWETGTGRAVTPPLRHGGPGAAAVFCAGDKQVAIAGRRGLVALWQLTPAGEAEGDTSLERRSVADLVRLAQVLSAARIGSHEEWQTLEMRELQDTWNSLNHDRSPVNSAGPSSPVGR